MVMTFAPKDCARDDQSDGEGVEDDVASLARRKPARTERNFMIWGNIPKD